MITVASSTLCRIAPPNRRQFIGSMAALPLAGCAPIVGGNGSACPAGPASAGVVNWIPDVAHPVLWGVQDVGPADGAPRPMQIYFPSPTLIPPHLLATLARFPVVLFLHGDHPQGVTTSGYFRRWWRIPAAIARCGYVVAVPDQGAVAFPDVSDVSRVAPALADIDFVRTKWCASGLVDKRPSATAVIGHSFGGVLAAMVAAQRPDFGACISLSGVFLGVPGAGPVPLLAKVTMPRLFMFSTDGVGANENENLFNGVWDHLAEDKPKYAVAYHGEHFDYLEPGDIGSEPRGACPLVGGVAADLCSLFLATTIASLTQVKNDLSRPQVTLSDVQRLLAAGSLESMDQAAISRKCAFDLRWSVFGESGTRHIGA